MLIPTEGTARPGWGGGAFLALLSTLVLVGGCDTSVQPLNPADQNHYSVFGVLDPARDTQWVRVEPLQRLTSEGAPGPLDVTVTLQNLDTDQTWTLQDSLMLVQSERHHNFWTNAPIAPGTAYRVTVRGSEDRVTQATTTTPDRPPSVKLEDPIRLPCVSFTAANRFVVTLTEIDKLAAVKMRYFQSVFGPSVTYQFDHYEDAVKRDDSTYAVPINYAKDLQRAQRTRERRCLADSAKVITVAGGPNWPEWARLQGASLAQLARPDSFTNVEGGHGLIEGVYSNTKKVPIRQRDQQ